MNPAAGAAMARVGPPRPLVVGRAEAWAVLLAARCCPRACGWCEAVADEAEACCGAGFVGVGRRFRLEHNGQQFCLNLQLCQRF